MKTTRWTSSSHKMQTMKQKLMCPSVIGTWVEVQLSERLLLHCHKYLHGLHLYPKGRCSRDWVLPASAREQSSLMSISESQDNRRERAVCHLFTSLPSMMFWRMYAMCVLVPMDSRGRQKILGYSYRCF